MAAPPKSGVKWTTKEQKKLMDAHAAGIPYKHLEVVFGRTNLSCRLQVHKLKKSGAVDRREKEVKDDIKAATAAVALILLSEISGTKSHWTPINKPSKGKAPKRRQDSVMAE